MFFLKCFLEFHCHLNWVTDVFTVKTEEKSSTSCIQGFHVCIILFYLTPLHAEYVNLKNCCFGPQQMLTCLPLIYVSAWFGDHEIKPRKSQELQLSIQIAFCSWDVACHEFLSLPCSKEETKHIGHYCILIYTQLFLFSIVIQFAQSHHANCSEVFNALNN